MNTIYSDTAFLGNTVAALPSFFANVQDIPMGYLDNLPAIRRSCRMTQEELSVAIGRAQGTVSKWERGFQEPSFPDLFKMASVLRVNPGELLTAEDEVDGDEPPRKKVPTVAAIASLITAAQPFLRAGRASSDSVQDVVLRLAAQIHSLAVNPEWSDDPSSMRTLAKLLVDGFDRPENDKSEQA